MQREGAPGRASDRPAARMGQALGQALGPRLGLAQISLTGILWGTTGVVVRVVRDHSGLGPAAIGFYRLAIAAVVLLAFALPRGGLVTAFRRAPVALLLTGAGLGAYQALYFLAVAQAGVSVATVVSLGLAPVLIAVWEAVQARRVPGMVPALTVLAAVVGLALVALSSTHASSAAPHPLLGLLVAVVSGAGYAATTVLSRHVSLITEPLALTTISATVGAVVLAPVALVAGITFGGPVSSVGWLVYLGVVTTAVAYGLFYSGLRTVAGSVAAVLTLLEPLTAAVLAVALLHEPLSALTVVGGLLMLAAVAALYLRPEDPEPVTATELRP